MVSPFRSFVGPGLVLAAGKRITSVSGQDKSWPYKTASASSTRSRLVREFAFRRFGALAVLVALAGVAILCGLFVDGRVVSLGAAALAVGVLGVAWPLGATRFLSGTLRFGAHRADERVGEGDDIELELRVRNRAPFAAHGLVLRGLTADDGKALALNALDGGRETTLSRTLEAPMRGEYPVGEARLATRFPFGVWEGAQRVKVENRLLVWPRTVDVGPIPDVAGARRHEGAVCAGSIGHGGEVVGVRPFREGDSLRRVHWAQTARFDRLIVCETQGTQLPLLEIALDLDARFHVGEGRDSTREWAIRLAASFCRHWCDDGALVALDAGTARLNAASGARHRDAMLDALARIRPADDATLAQIFERAGARSNAGLRVVVTTDAALRELSDQIERGQAHVSGVVPLLFVVLETSAWNGGKPSHGTLPGRGAVLRIEGPNDMTAQVRRGLEEAFRAF